MYHVIILTYRHMNVYQNIICECLRCIRLLCITIYDTIMFVFYLNRLIRMTNSLQLPTLSHLHLDTDEEGTSWLWYDDFYNLLRKARAPTDTKNIRTDVVQKEIKGHKNGFRTVGDRKQVNLSSVLRYTLNHQDDFVVCEQISQEVKARCVTVGHSSVVASIYEIYNMIAKSRAPSGAFHADIFTNIMDGAIIPTIHHEHRSHFSDAEWHAICVFEWHFSRDINIQNCTYEEEVKKRWDFWMCIQEASKNATKASTEYKRHISQKMKRKASAELEAGMTIHGEKLHVPALIDIQLLGAIEETFPQTVNCVVCIDCAPQFCGHGISSGTGIHCFIEMLNNDQTMLPDIACTIQSVLANEHNEACMGVLFFNKGTLECYMEGNEGVQRYHLRNAVISGAMGDGIFHSWSPEESRPIHISNTDQCSNCFDFGHVKPLHWQQLDCPREWTLEVPLLSQIFLEAFINAKSLTKSSNKTRFLESKITRLLFSFDSLLNLLNRGYSGIQQDLNTQELAMHSHDISTVFSVTTQFGASSSLSTSERRLKQEASPDLLCFNTYFKRYPLQYANETGSATRNVSIQECIPVFFMDNLVRLTSRTDPSRGQSRSCQLPMLPLTVKGLPLDSVEIQQWHDGEICDGSSDCVCKQPIQLSSSDLQTTLLELRPEEAKVMTKFREICTWGLLSNWNQIYRGEIKERIDAAQVVYREYHGHDQNDDLNVSFQSLSIAETCDAELDFELAGLSEKRLENTKCEDQGHDKLLKMNETLGNLSNIPLSELQKSSLSEGSSSFCSTDHESESESNNSPSEYDIITDSGGEDAPATDHGAVQIHDISCIPEDAQQKTESLYDLLGTESDEDALGEPLPASMPTDHSAKEEKCNVTDVISDGKCVPCDVTGIFGLTKFKAPEMICRHPPPAVGRDDDLMILKNILDELLINTGYLGPHNTLLRSEKILFGPDNKIGKNLLLLMQQNKKYKCFLPEFPLLHLRKSKITNLGAAFKHGGIVQLLKYMKNDDQENDWAKLVTVQNIDAATRVIKRLSQALHLAFFVSWIEQLKPEEVEEITVCLEVGELNVAMDKYNDKLKDYIHLGATSNATFALHVEIMNHCDEVLAISMAERMGGPDGYALLLAAVKDTLPFAFLNGSNAYATYCTQLLLEHYQAGPFHQNLKTSLFSTPHRGSKSNFGLDTQREMDHRDAIKGFRPRGTVQSILPRMSLVDKMSDVTRKRITLQGEDAPSLPDTEGNMLWTLSEKDVAYILPTAQLILRQGAITLEADKVPKNVYAKEVQLLPDAVLDRNTWSLGCYLIKRYACTQGILGLSMEDLPPLDDVPGPPALKRRIKSSKGITIRRVTGKLRDDGKTRRQVEEKQRKQKVSSETHRIQCLSSKMNCCQALVKPDCSKPGVQKARTIRLAIMHLLSGISDDLVASQDIASNLEQQTKPVMLGLKKVPPHIFNQVQVVTVEFAGVKFKAWAMTGPEYVNHVGKKVIGYIRRVAPNAKRIVICEEKYLFTPDDLKAATRAKRTSTAEKNICHLKSTEEMVNETTFDKVAVMSTQEGKTMISTYLARNVSKLQLHEDLTVVIDSELYLEGCTCTPPRDLSKCSCDIYSTPLTSTFSRSSGFVSEGRLSSVKQCKGEAEMSQGDWIIETTRELADGEGVLSVVSSGDIDAIIIHLFAVSLYMPRHPDGKFKHKVYVLLQKPLLDLYDITAMLETLESHFVDPQIGVKLALALCLGGNDFVLKYHGQSHDKIVQLYISSSIYMEELFQLQRDSNGHLDSITVNLELYTEFIKHLYTPKNKDQTKLSFDVVRQLSIKDPKKMSPRNPQKWLPPKTALLMAGTLLQCQADYLLTVGKSSAPLPKFLERGCLRKVEGEIEYHFGDDEHVDNWESLLVYSDPEILENLKRASVKQNEPKKRRLDYTPKKGKSSKRSKPKVSTPLAKLK